MTRRRAPRPRRRTAALAVAGAATVLAGGACADDGGEPTATTRAPADLAGASLCEDPAGDADGPIDLRSVGVVVRGDDLVVTWDHDPHGETEPVTWSMIALPYQVGIEAAAEEGAAVGFLVDLDREARTDLPDEDVRLRPDQAQVVVPLADLDGIVGEWTATVAVDGTESDACGPSPLPGT